MSLNLSEVSDRLDMYVGTLKGVRVQCRQMLEAGERGDSSATRRLSDELYQTAFEASNQIGKIKRECDSYKGTDNADIIRDLSLSIGKHMAQVGVFLDEIIIVGQTLAENGIGGDSK